MTTLFPFATAVPAGIQGTVLSVFVALGAILLLNMVLHTGRRYVFPAVVHVGAGFLAVCAADLMTLLVAWEALSFSAFFLIRGKGTTEGRKISLRYLGVHVTAAVFFFFAVLFQYRETGSFTAAILVPVAQPFMMVAVLIKTATMPFHFWLTDAYPSVDPAITPLLSVFTTKVGVLTAARLLWISPAGYPALAWLGAGTAVAAVILALMQHNARKLLSYHIVSQVGYMVAGIGLAVGFSEYATTAGLFHLVTHTLYKALLLLVAAWAIRRNGTEDLTRMEGSGFTQPLLLICGVIGAVAISGVPFTSGYASKYLLKEAAHDHAFVAILLNMASIGTGLSFIKFIFLIFFNNRGHSHLKKREIPGAPDSRSVLAMVPLVLIAGITVVIGVFPTILPGVPRRAYFAPTSLVSALYPLAGSAVLWIVLKTRLASPDSSDASRPGTPVSRKITLATQRVRARARHLHEQGPQVQIVFILVVLLITAGLLRLMPAIGP